MVFVKFKTDGQEEVFVGASMDDVLAEVTASFEFDPSTAETIEPEEAFRLKPMSYLRAVVGVKTGIFHSLRLG